MKKVVLYGHGGSHNHGCEALIITMVETLKNIDKNIEVILYSNFSENDYKWGLDKIVNEIRKMPNPSLTARITRKLKKILKIKERL